MEDSSKKGSASELKAAAIEYANNNIAVFPLQPFQKIPIHTGGFKNASSDPRTIAMSWDANPGANIGMSTGLLNNCFVIDLDVKNGSNGFESLDKIEAEHGKLPETRIASTPNGGEHRLFRSPATPIKSQVAVLPGIDVRGEGGYIVVAPSRLTSGEYVWKNPDAPIAEAPSWLIQLLTQNVASWNVNEHSGGAIPAGRRNDFLYRMACSFRRWGVREEELARWLLDSNHRCQPPLNETEIRGIAKSAAKIEPAELLFPKTDAGNAELFASINHGELLYNHQQEHWLLWVGHWWTQDETEEVVRRVKHSARERQIRCSVISDEEERKQQYKFGLKSENRSRIDACIKLAQSEPALSDAGRDWDCEPWLMGVANGIIDLRTGQIREGKPVDRISLHTDVVHDSTATCTRWEQFLREVFRKDTDLINYVQRAIGYTLTGVTTEHVMFIAYGNGANGKSVMLRVLAELFGQYSKVTAASTLDTAYKSTISNDVAALAGKRLVWASETEQTASLNEAKVKQLVHADEVTARFMYRELFTFTPVAKFWLTVNDLPTIRDSSHGMWRSIHILPFLAQFDGSNADPNLTDKLMDELPGILNWAIAGCLEWQKHGLCAPDVVKAATEEYREQNDPLAEYVNLCCEVGDDKSGQASALYQRYRTWAEANKIKERDVLTQTTFGCRMKKKFEWKKTGKGNFYYGVALRPECPE